MIAPLHAWSRILRLPSRSLQEARPTCERLNRAVGQAWRELAASAPSGEIEQEEEPGGRFSIRLQAAEFIIIVQCSCGMDCTRRDGNLVEFVSYTITAEVRVRAMDRILRQHARCDLPSRIFLGVFFTALAGWLSFTTIQTFAPRPGHFENMTTMLALLVGAVAGERFGAFLPAWVAVRALERERVEAVGSAGEGLWGLCLQRLANITQPYEKL